MIIQTVFLSVFVEILKWLINKRMTKNTQLSSKNDNQMFNQRKTSI